LANLTEILDAARNLNIDDQQQLVKLLSDDLKERRKAPHTRSAEFAAVTVKDPSRSKSSTVNVEDILRDSR
jgi:hypothetical protein